VGDKNKPSSNCTKAFFGEKKLQKSPYFEKKKSHVAIFKTMSSYWSPEIGRDLFLKLLYCLTFSQMRLIPLEDDRQSTHLTKLEKKALLLALLSIMKFLIRKLL